MSLKEVIDDIDRKLPQFNDKLLLDYNKNLINGCRDYVDKVFAHAVEYINDTIEDARQNSSINSYGMSIDTFVEQPTTVVTYKGSKVLGPVEQVKYETNKGLGKEKISIERDERMLVECAFEINGEPYTTELYLPYWINNGLIMNGKIYAVKHVLCDKIVRLATGDGIIMRVMRSPLHFWRNEEIVLKDIHGKETSVKYITCKAHYKTNTKKKYQRTPLVLYILATYGLTEGINKFVPSGCVTVCQTADMDDEDHLYFQAIPGIYVKCETDAFASTVCKRVVASLIYIFRIAAKDITGYGDKKFDSLSNKDLYIALIGRIIYGEKYSLPQAYGHGESHLRSLNTYIDAASSAEFKRDYNITIRNIFELFIFVFFNIDTYLAGYSPNDLFEKKLGNVDKLLRDCITSNLFNKIYRVSRGKELKPKNIADALRIKPTSINDIYKDESIATGTEAYNDDMLFNQLCHKLLQSRSAKGSKKGGDSNTINHKEHQFSPSFVAIESILSISTSNPGVAGDINPFAQIDEDGCFDESKMPWYDQIKGLSNLLVPL